MLNLHAVIKYQNRFFFFFFEYKRIFRNFIWFTLVKTQRKPCVSKKKEKKEKKKWTILWKLWCKVSVFTKLVYSSAKCRDHTICKSWEEIKFTTSNSKETQIVLLKIGLMNKIGFKTSSFPCKSQLRYCYLKSGKWLPFFN